MWPVGTPENPVGGCSNQRLCERYCISKRRTVAGDSFRAGNLDPATGRSARQVDQLSERFLLQAGLCRHPAHVINDERHWQVAQQIVITNEINRVKVQINVPTQGFDAGNHALELIHVRHAAQVLHEVEAHAAKARLVEIFEHSIGERIVGVGYASITATALSDGVDDDGIVSSVTARVHEHGSFQAQNRLQFLEPGERRVGWRIRTIGCVRISVTWAKYVAMGVTTACRRAILGAASVGVWRLTAGNIRHVCYRSDGPSGTQSGPTDDRTTGMKAMEFTHLINGTAVSGDATLEVINPATGAVFARCPAANAEQLDAAVSAARAAFPSWKARSFAERAAFIGRMAGVLREHQETLAQLLTREQGKPIGQARDEIGRAATQSEGMAEIRIGVETLADDGQRRIELHYRPLGVVGIITPWNAPINLAAGPITAALYTGNTAVLKPSPFTPLTTLKLGELLRDVFPPGVLNVVAGGDELGRLMSEHPHIDKISFTGSVATGKRVMASAAGTLKRV